MNKPTLTIVRKKISDLHADPANANRHPENNLRAIADSLHAFGQVEPLVVQKGTGKVIGGNGRLEVLRNSGAQEVDVVELDIDGTQATALAIALNRTAKTSEFDDETLASLLQSLPQECQIAAGFDPDELNELLSKLTPEVVEDVAPEPPASPVSRLGDLWVCGEHRVLCGDSTSADDVGRLMDGEKADLCFTSPPYGQQRDYTKESDCSDWDKLMNGVFANLPMAESGQVLVNLGLIHRDGEWVPYWDGWIEWMREQGWRRFGWYVWDQGESSPGASQGRLPNEHEWIFHFNKATIDPSKVVPCKHANKNAKATGQHEKDGSQKAFSATVGTHKPQGSVITAPPAKGGSSGHPAPFSVDVVATVAMSWSGTMYEPFCGSGTTLIAAEQLGRKCYGMEISPQYVDVIVTRWEKLTGKQATLESTGKTFADTATERGIGD